MKLKTMKFGSNFINSLINICVVSTLKLWYHVETDCFANISQKYGVTFSESKSVLNLKNTIHIDLVEGGIMILRILVNTT